MNSPTPTLTDLFQMVHQVVADTWPERTPCRLIITTLEGNEIALPIPARSFRQAAEDVFVTKSPCRSLVPLFFFRPC
jgi:hypothetical protein